MQRGEEQELGDRDGNRGGQRGQGRRDYKLGGKGEQRKKQRRKEPEWDRPLNHIPFQILGFLSLGIPRLSE